MNRQWLVMAVAAGWLAGWSMAGAAENLTLAEKICVSYEQVQSVSCRVRKTTSAAGGSITLLSQVYYRRPDCLHVENISPIHRRIMADGTNFYYYVDGAACGFSVPIAELEGEMLLMQKSVPGSAMEHLLRFKEQPETDMPPTAKYPLRRGYAMKRNFAVLNCDVQGRLALIEVFESAGSKKPIARIEYSDFRRVSDDCWLAGRQRSEILFQGQKTVESRRFDAFTINKPVADSQFEATAYFEGVEFTNDFSATIGSRDASTAP